MTPLRQQLITALQLHGKGERTQQASVRAVRLLAQFYGKSPDRISELTFRTPFRSSEAILAEPPEERGG